MDSESRAKFYFCFLYVLVFETQKTVSVLLHMQAAVLGAAKAIGALEPEGVEVHFIVAACEVCKSFFFRSIFLIRYRFYVTCIFDKIDIFHIFPPLLEYDQ